MAGGAVCVANRLFPLISSTFTEVVNAGIVPDQARVVVRQGSTTEKVKGVDAQIVVCGAGRHPVRVTE